MPEALPEPEWIEEPGPSPSGKKGRKATIRRTCPECGGKIPTGKSRCPDCGEFYAAARNRRRIEAEGGDVFAPEKKALNWGMAGGVLMMVIAFVWFFAGLTAGYVFFYPPILFIIGVVGLLKGLATGNIAGNQPTRRRRRRRM